jgi:drug/metabolite transporter (DMT)-like permease
VILGERLLPVQMIGGAVIVLGVFLVNRPGRSAAPARG